MKSLAVVLQPLHVRPGLMSFPGPLEPLLQHHYEETVVIDTSAACAAGHETVAGIAGHWQTLLPQIQDADLLAGNALGGAVAHEIARTAARPITLITISAPTHSTERLDAAFTRVIEATCEHGAQAGADILDASVGAPPAGDRDIVADAEERLVRGLRALRGHHCPGGSSSSRHLTVVGAGSTLARRENVCACDAPAVLELPGVGMRPHVEASEAVVRAIDLFLKRGGSR